MRPLTELAPPPAATPELLAQTWTSEGLCANPETVGVDFGAKAGRRACTIELGLREDGTWRAGYTAVTKAGVVFAEPCEDDGLAVAYTTRAAALRAALKYAERHYEGDAPAARAFAAVFAKSFAASEAAAAEAAGAGLPANTPTAGSAPLARPEPREVPVAAIQPNPEQPRRAFSAEEEMKLAQGIASVGLLQRVGVRRLLAEELGEFPDLAGAERFELIYGERRWRACQRLQWEAIPAEVYTGLTRAQAKAAALIENLQREALDPIEEAEGYRDLIATEGLTQEQCAERVGRSRPVVANALRLLELPAAVVTHLREGRLTTAHGMALLRWKAWPAAVAIMVEETLAGGLSAAALEQGVPCLAALVRAGVVVQCHAHEVDHEWPAALKKHPAYVILNEWSRICFEPEHWRGLVAAHAEEKRLAAEAAAEKQRKEAEKASRRPGKVKSLEDLPQGSVRIVGDESALALLPDATTSELPLHEGGATVTVCSAPDLAGVVESLLRAAKAEDRRAKWPDALRRARAALGKVKKLGARELALLFWLAGTDSEGFRPRFAEADGKDCGVKLPKRLFHPDYESIIDFTPANLALLSEAAEPVRLWAALVEKWLAAHEHDCAEDGHYFSPESDLGTLCKWLLASDELGFLEETKAGLRALQKLVEGNGEYQAALAAATTKDGDKPAKKARA